MAAITVQDWLVLPRIGEPAPDAVARPVVSVVTGRVSYEGEGFQVRRPFPSPDLNMVDPFLLFDHLGAVEYAPGEARGAPWHPHRGFETVTYIMDGTWVHHDSLGGGGLIGDGATQWMTAGAGILHDELPTEDLVAKGGLFHGVQLWVNLPAHLKWTPPRYQSIEPQSLTLLTSSDGGSLVRVIAGEVDGHAGPGSTWTPIAYLHASVAPGAQLRLPWRPDFSALVYVLAGEGVAGHTAAVREGQLAVYGPGDSIEVRAAERQPTRTQNLEVLVLGGAPIREPVAHYGPFVMNTRDELVQAVEDFRAGRMGTIPAETLTIRAGDGAG